jgi:peroxiredoxin family protein
MRDDDELRRLIERVVDERVSGRLAELDARLDDVVARLNVAAPPGTRDRASILVFSGDFDHLLSAFIVAVGAVSMGVEVSMYFTFWGLAALKRKTIFAGKKIEERLLSLILPGGPDGVGTSRLNMFGLGPALFKRMMADKHVETLPGLIAVARELGVKLTACKMTMDVMGIRDDELIEGVEYGGAATYVAEAIESKITLFI